MDMARCQDQGVRGKAKLDFDQAQSLGFKPQEASEGKTNRKRLVTVSREDCAS